MKNLIILLITIPFIFGASACGQNNSANLAQADLAVAGEKIDVYYFHFTNRCATCISVQNATEKVLADHYKEDLDKGNIVYHEINLSEPSSRDIAMKLGVGGQALLVVSGNKKFDITLQGFLNAPRNYDSFKEILDTAISDAKT